MLCCTLERNLELACTLSLCRELSLERLHAHLCAPYSVQCTALTIHSK
jgi:hypothetical protein